MILYPQGKEEMMHNHLKALYARHGVIDAKIIGEQNRPLPDDMRLRALKKMKLRLRDQIRIMERRFQMAS